MARERPTVDLPTEIGWYIVRRMSADPVRRLGPPELYFCVESTVGKIACMSARPSEEEDFAAVTDACFLRALWHGPFKTRKEAREVLEEVT
jgi:hypothetical protein